MNSRAQFKTLILLLMILISLFFIFNTQKNGIGISQYPLITILTLPININLFEKRKKVQKNKILKLFFLLLTSINLIWIIYYLYHILITNFMDDTYLNSLYFYLIIIFTIFINSILDLKRETNFLNDILTILVSIIIILVHYRYYVDKSFLHNLVGNVNESTKIHFITQYYPYFIIMYLVLFIQKKIANIST